MSCLLMRCFVRMATWWCRCVQCDCLAVDSWTDVTWISKESGKGEFMPVHAMKAEVRVEIQLHSYLSFELEGDECLTGRFTPRDRSSGTNRVATEAVKTLHRRQTLWLWLGIETWNLGFPTNSLVNISTGIHRMNESRNVVYSENTGNNDICSK